MFEPTRFWNVTAFACISAQQGWGAYRSLKLRTLGSFPAGDNQFGLFQMFCMSPLGQTEALEIR